MVTLGWYNYFSSVVQGMFSYLVGLGIVIDGVHEGADPPILRAILCGQVRIAKLLLELGVKMVDPVGEDWKEEFQNTTYPLID